jgi:hypothetical protein
MGEPTSVCPREGAMSWRRCMSRAPLERCRKGERRRTRQGSRIGLGLRCCPRPDRAPSRTVLCAVSRVPVGAANARGAGRFGDACRLPPCGHKFYRGYQGVGGPVRRSWRALLACLDHPHPLSGCVPRMRAARGRDLSWAHDGNGGPRSQGFMLVVMRRL